MGTYRIVEAMREDTWAELKFFTKRIFHNSYKEGIP